jgi:stage V sporulation protein SpoVS
MSNADVSGNTATMTTTILNGSHDPSFLVAKGRFIGTPDQTAQAEKVHVKGLASAIFMSLMNHGDVKLRSVGRGASYNAIKAAAIAGGYCRSKHVDICWDSSFDEGNLGQLQQGNHVQNVTAILSRLKGFVKDAKDRPVPTSDRNDPGFLVAKGNFQSGDQIQTDQEKAHIKSLASAIFMSIVNHNYARVRAVGKIASYNALKAITIASGYCKPKGIDLCWQPYFTEGNIGDLKDSRHVFNVTAIMFNVMDLGVWKKG